MTDTTMSDLLPCPFCGGEAGKIADATRILGTFNLIHRCPIIGGVEIKRATQEGVIARWNTRTPSQAQIDAAVRAERDRCAKVAAAHLERVQPHSPDDDMLDKLAQGYGNAALNIAAAICNGDQP